MGERAPFNLKDLVLRVFIVLIAGVAILRFVLFLTDLFWEDEHSQFSHLLIAVITSVLTFILLFAMLKYDRFSWNQLGQGTLKQNVKSFLLGLFLWIVPAAIGLVICISLGWVDLKLNSNIDTLLWSILLLFVTVFFMEALPEEFIFRGYIYQYLNVVFPHWATIIIQTLLFSLFAYLIGAMYSMEQIQFIPGFAIILGIFRAISGSVWTSIGFHVAIMTATQILGPVHGLFEVSNMFTLQFIAFILLPSTIGAIVLSFMFTNFKWGNKEAL
ncbi:CPBP family intramembrane glutamic endopeptidase [Ornithinibacillus halotolerans]|uniref:CAAX prenyl protease 2/Lysostaphin resistance protein A-like domain-containing protein n=1 Tax=Ornithinibacillus halotolerans TaxID=1274357 RepID=A0A916S9I9_9BACI|nr:type II CAAX endopeptidase family protein [Ornithinibacillus halotolerans]GGA89926.1 hypothetical protein GCM10008025_35640 [Ornithinibacillus halotolerans]